MPPMAGALPRRRADTLRSAGLLLALGALGVACAGLSNRVAARLGKDAPRPPGVTVLGVQERGAYLDVVVQDDERVLRRLVPRTKDCAFVLILETRVAFEDHGIAGRFRRADVTCDAIGIGDPLLSRSRRGRSGMGAIIPRAQATFAIVYQDAEVMMLRGRFPLAARLGFAGGADCVAVVRNDPPCRRAVESGVASLEFRARGPYTLALVGGSSLCRIDMLALPPAGP